MRIRSLLLAIPFLLVGVVSPASAAFMVEYIILVTFVQDGGTWVEDLQIPKALEEDCLRDPDVSGLCYALDGIVGKSTNGALRTLDSVGAVLEDTAPIDDLARQRLTSDDCGASATESGGWIGSGADAFWGGMESELLPESEAASIRGSSNLSKMKQSARAGGRAADGFLWVSEDAGRGHIGGRSADSFTYTISDGYAGENVARHLDMMTSRPRSCVDRMQDRLQNGDSLMLPELTRTEDDGLSPGETWVFVYSVPTSR